jgi:hypothetical protein
VSRTCGGNEQIRDGIQALTPRVLRSRCPVFPDDPRVRAIREKQFSDLERAVFIVRKSEEGRRLLVGCPRELRIFGEQLSQSRNVAHPAKCPDIAT